MSQNMLNTHGLGDILDLAEVMNLPTPISPIHSRSTTPLEDEPCREGGMERTVTIKQEDDNNIQILGEVRRYETKNDHARSILAAISRGYSAAELLKPAMVTAFKKKNQPKVLYLNSKVVMMKCGHLHLLCEAIINVLRGYMEEGSRVNLEAKSVEELQQLDMLLKHTFTDFRPTTEPEVEWNQDKFIKISEIWKDTTKNSALEMCESLRKAGEWETSKSLQQKAKDQLLIELQLGPTEIKDAINKLATTMVITPFTGDFLEKTEEQRKIEEQGRIINSLTKELERVKKENLQRMEEKEEESDKALQDSQKDNDKLFVQWREQQDKIDKLQDELNKVKKAKKDESLEYDQTITGLKDKYQKLQNDYDDTDKKYKKLTTQLNNMEEKAGKQKTDLVTAQNKLRNASVIITRSELEEIVAGAVKRTHNGVHKPQCNRDRNISSTSSNNRR